MSYHESNAQKDTTCDGCNAELPKGIDIVVDDDTNRLFCGVECWEEDQQEEENN